MLRITARVSPVPGRGCPLSPTPANSIVISATVDSGKFDRGAVRTARSPAIAHPGLRRLQFGCQVRPSRGKRRRQRLLLGLGRPRLAPVEVLSLGVQDPDWLGDDARRLSERSSYGAVQMRLDHEHPPRDRVRPRVKAGEEVQRRLYAGSHLLVVDAGGLEFAIASVAQPVLVPHHQRADDLVDLTRVEVLEQEHLRPGPGTFLGCVVVGPVLERGRCAGENESTVPSPRQCAREAILSADVVVKRQVKVCKPPPDQLLRGDWDHEPIDRRAQVVVIRDEPALDIQVKKYLGW